MAKRAKSSARKSTPKPSPIPIPDDPTMKGCSSSASPGNGYRIPSSPDPQSTPPIHVAIPNTTREKMQAIVMLCSAVQRLSAALDSVNCPVLVKDCQVSNSQGHGMSFGLTQDTPDTKFARQVAEFVASGGKVS